MLRASLIVILTLGIFPTLTADSPKYGPEGETILDTDVELKFDYYRGDDAIKKLACIGEVEPDPIKPWPVNGLYRSFKNRCDVERSFYALVTLNTSHGRTLEHQYKVTIPANTEIEFNDCFYTPVRDEEEVTYVNLFWQWQSISDAVQAKPYDFENPASPCGYRKSHRVIEPTDPNALPNIGESEKPLFPEEEPGTMRDREFETGLFSVDQYLALDGIAEINQMAGMNAQGFKLYTNEYHTHFLQDSLFEMDPLKFINGKLIQEQEGGLGIGDEVPDLILELSEVKEYYKWDPGSRDFQLSGSDTLIFEDDMGSLGSVKRYLKVNEGSIRPKGLQIRGKADKTQTGIKYDGFTIYFYEELTAAGPCPYQKAHIITGGRSLEGKWKVWHITYTISYLSTNCKDSAEAPKPGDMQIIEYSTLSLGEEEE